MTLTLAERIHRDGCRITDNMDSRYRERLWDDAHFDRGAELYHLTRQARRLVTIATTPRWRRLWCRLADMSEDQDWDTLGELYRDEHARLVAVARQYVAACRGQPARPAMRRGKLPDRIGAIKQHVDIVSFAGRFTTLKRAGKEYVGCCPLHDDRSPSFSVSAERGLWYCHACAVGGSVIDLAAALRECGRW